MRSTLPRSPSAGLSDLADLLLVVVIPALNEEATIVSVIDGIPKEVEGIGRLTNRVRASDAPGQ